MAEGQFEPIILRYDGLDASRQQLDLAQLGISLQGASRLIGVTAHYAVTGRYAKKSPALHVRVLAGAPRGNCLEIPAFIYAIKPAIDPILPAIHTFGNKMVEAMVAFVIARVAGKKDAEDAAMEALKEALKEQGQTSRTAIEAMRDVALAVAASNTPAVRNFASPVGETCETARIGQIKNGAVSVDRCMKDLICQEGPKDIEPERDWRVYLTELDLQAHTCKFSLEADDDQEKRHQGLITDPLVQTANNIYAAAMTAHRWLTVRGKAEITDGDLAKLYISDVVAG